MSKSIQRSFSKLQVILYLLGAFALATEILEKFQSRTHHRGEETQLDEDGL